MKKNMKKWQGPIDDRLQSFRTKSRCQNHRQDSSAGRNKTLHFNQEINWISAINFAPMTDSKQINLLLRRVKFVNHSIIPDAQAKGIGSSHSVVRIGFQTSTHPVNFCFDSTLYFQRKFLKSMVKRSVINLKRLAHVIRVDARAASFLLSSRVQMPQSAP